MRMIRTIALGLLVWLTVQNTATAGATPCAGDCDNDGEVTVNEVVRVVNIGLGLRLVATCSAGDLDGNEHVTVNEIIQTVNNALNGCLPQLTPTRTATQSRSTRTPTPTQTATPSPKCVRVGCVVSAQYWREHPDEWPFTRLFIGGNDRDQRYISSRLLVSGGLLDISRGVGRELATAMLNEICAPPNQLIVDEIDEADIWFRDRPSSANLTEDERRKGEGYIFSLGQYNAGESGVVRCGVDTG